MDLKTIMISYFAFSARTITKISFNVVIISECLFLMWQYCISPIVWKRQLWVNRLAEELRLINPHWDGDRLYQGSGSKQIRGDFWKISPCRHYSNYLSLKTTTLSRQLTYLIRFLITNKHRKTIQCTVDDQSSVTAIVFSLKIALPCPACPVQWWGIQNTWSIDIVGHNGSWVC